jgi:hypothetical protein
VCALCAPQVRSIPTLVVLEISDDGKHARVLSREGRSEVLQGSAAPEWLRRVLPLTSDSGDAAPAPVPSGGSRFAWLMGK